MRPYPLVPRLLSCLIVAGGLMAHAERAAAANMVVNGGFETGDLSAWTSSAGLDFSGVACPGSAAAAEGICHGYFGPSGAGGSLSQSVATQAGTSYVISFALAGFGDPSSNFSVSWGAQTLYSVANPAGGAFAPLSFTATAASASTNLSFAFRDELGFIYLDAVSVSAVPEPASATLAALGLGLIGLAAGRMRRRR